MDFINWFFFGACAITIVSEYMQLFKVYKQNKELRKEVHYKQLEVNACLKTMRSLVDGIEELSTANKKLEDENKELDDENESLSEERDALESFMADVYTTIYAEHQKKKKVKNLQRKIKNKENK